MLLFFTNYSKEPKLRQGLLTNTPQAKVYAD